jgi:hypothetical protein
MYTLFQYFIVIYLLIVQWGTEMQCRYVLIAASMRTECYRLTFAVMKQARVKMVSLVVSVVTAVRAYENIALSSALASRRRAAN